MRDSIHRAVPQNKQWGWTLSNQTDGNARKFAKEAFIYVPGIIEPTGGSDVVLRKMAVALGAVNPSFKGLIDITPVEPLAYGRCVGEGQRAKRWSFVAADNGQVLYDFIEVDYRADLNSHSQSRWIKFIRLAFMSYWLTMSIARTAVTMHRKTLWQRLQLLYMAGLAAVSGIFMFVLIERIYDFVKLQLGFKDALERGWIMRLLPDQNRLQAAISDTEGVARLVWRWVESVPAMIYSSRVVIGVILFIVFFILVLLAFHHARDWVSEIYDGITAFIRTIHYRYLPRTPLVRRRYYCAWWVVSVAAVLTVVVVWGVENPVESARGIAFLRPHGYLSALGFAGLLSTLRSWP